MDPPTGGGFQKLRDAILGVPVIRVNVFWGSMLGSLGSFPLPVTVLQGAL